MRGFFLLRADGWALKEAQNRGCANQFTHGIQRHQSKNDPDKRIYGCHSAVSSVGVKALYFYYGTNWQNESRTTVSGS
jgi:hypothetical protein